MKSIEPTISLGCEGRVRLDDMQPMNGSLLRGECTSCCVLLSFRSFSRPEAR